MVNKPNADFNYAVAVKQRPRISVESSRTTDKRAAGCFKLRVGSVRCILACTWDRVKQYRKVLRAHVHTAGSTYYIQIRLQLRYTDCTVKECTPRYHDTSFKTCSC